MSCLMSCSSSARKNHHHYSFTTDDSTATLVAPTRDVTRPLPRQEAQSYGGDLQRYNYSSERERGPPSAAGRHPQDLLHDGPTKQRGEPPIYSHHADPFIESTESPIHSGI
ncbi:unnamed protein product [Linum trigynum]|uniref:Uncharacterized protein n=1 Tax=Linum trigynum TaxID=586398 RepID=A0AAV2D7U9_9ROSI